MKKILLIFFLFLFAYIQGNLFAQDKDLDYSLSKYYVKVTTGYGIGTNGPYQNFYNGRSPSLYSGKSGNGLYSGASIGYQYNSNLGAEIGFGYEYGFKNDIPDFNVRFNGNMWQTVPALVFSSKAGIFRPYIRTGLIIGLPEVYIYQSDYNQLLRLHGGIASGIQGALGCSVPLRNKKWVVFTEASFNDIGFVPQQGTIVAETFAGVNQMPYLTEIQKETVYKKSFNPGANTNNQNQPYTSPEIKQPFNAFVINAGIRLNIGHMPVKAVDDYVSQHILFRLNAGYGMATNGDLDYKTAATTNAINVSYGTGLNYGAGVAYMFNQTIGFDLGASYVSGPDIKADNGGALSPNLFNDYSNVKSTYGNMFQVNPSFVISTHINKLLPYARLGMILGSGNVYFNSEDSRAYLNGNYYDRQTTERFYGGLQTGYSATVGVAFWLSYRYDLFVEACFNNVYDIPEKGQVIKDNYNNVSNLSNENYSNKNFVFVPGYPNFNSNQNPDSPTAQSQVDFSFNTCVINFGIRMWFKRANT